MIIPNKHELPELPSHDASDQVPDVPPPEYTPQASHASTSSTPVPSTLVPAAALDLAPLRRKSTNYLLLKDERRVVEGTYYIDPGMRIPAALLPPLKSRLSKEDRKNVYIKCDHRKVDVQLNLVSESFDKAWLPARATLKFVSDHGGVKVRINDLRPPETTTPIHVEMKGDHSSLTLCLPRSFNGPLHTSFDHGALVLSPEIQQQTITISSKINFIGDISSYTDDKSWIGDEAIMKTNHGKLFVWYTDEFEAWQQANPEPEKQKSAFRKFLGL